MYLSIDLGGTFIKYGVLDDDGRFHLKEKFPTPGECIDRLYGAIDELFDRLHPQFDFQGIAVSAPGSVTEAGFIEGVSAIPCIHGPNIRQDLQERCQLPVTIENDANCAALAEVEAGAARGFNDVLLIVLGTGVGGAVVRNGKLCRGRQLLGGEFGMMVQYDHQQQKAESISWLASPGNMLKRASKRFGRPLSGEEAFALAAQGNSEIQQEIESFYSHLAVLVTNLQCAIDPDVIVLSGGITERTQFAEELDSAMVKINDVRGALAVQSDVRVAQYRNDANLLGAYYFFSQEV